MIFLSFLADDTYLLGKGGRRLIEQQVIQLKLSEMHMLTVDGAAGPLMNAGVDKRVRDGIIRTHLAGDAVQRMEAARRLAR